MTAPTPPPTRRSARSVLGPALLVAALALSGACGSDSGDTGGEDAADGVTGAAAGPAEATTTTTEVATVPEGGYDVLTRTETLVDTTRATPALADTGVPAADRRTLATSFTYPDAPGRFPLVAFAHGHYGHPRKFTQLFEAWAAAGFVVAAPAFPLSNDEVPGAASPFDLPDQPGDLSFVISESLRLSGEDDGFLAGRVDPERIGVGGLSLGGATTYLTAFDECCLDERVDAAMVLDGLRPDASGLHLDRGIPLLIVHADEDPVASYSYAEQAFEDAAAPAYLVTLHEAVHSQPFEDTPDPADQTVLDTTTAFWRRHLAGDEAAAVALQEAAAVPGLTTFVARPG
ncbi:MAG: hypothetical protein KDB35_04450 [Acidimicrobiales bacterium]|nr:hypothetical protein [Acidimicrobiales bacterium]